MFGRKKMYKKGLQDAMHAYEKFSEKQEKALEQIREEIKAGNKKVEDMLTMFGEDLNHIYDFLTAKEKAALYNLCTPIDIAELGDEEKRLLLAVLYQLADDEGRAILNDSQRKYIRSVQRYLNITNPQTSVDLAVIENIDSLEIQKVFLQVVLEFLYLQDSDELTDEQEDFLGYFSLNMKQAQAIELNVSKIYNTVGAEGVCEKYGYCEVEQEKENDIVVRQDVLYETNAIYNPLEKIGTNMSEGLYIWEKGKFQNRRKIDDETRGPACVYGMTPNLVTFGYFLESMFEEGSFYYVDLREGEVRPVCFVERPEEGTLFSPFVCEKHILVENVTRQTQGILVYDKSGKIVTRKQSSGVKCFFESNNNIFVLREIRELGLISSADYYELYVFNDEMATIDFLCQCSNFFFEDKYIYLAVDMKVENGAEGSFKFYRMDLGTGKKDLLHTYCTDLYLAQVDMTLGFGDKNGSMYKKDDEMRFEYRAQGKKYSDKFSLK